MHSQSTEQMGDSEKRQSLTRKTYAERSVHWAAVRAFVKNQFGQRPNLNAILFLIGVNELGQLRSFEKEEKQDLMHIAVCYLLEADGFYRFIGRDDDGWPHYEALIELPNMKLPEQEALLKERIIAYFIDQGFISEQ